MPWLRDAPIRRKLIAVVVATSSCALLVITGVFLITTFVVVRRTVHGDLLTQSAIVADNTTAALAFGDRGAALETLLALRVSQSIDAACVYDRSGALFAQAHRAQGASLCPESAPYDLDELTMDGVRVARPIALGPRRIGTLYLAGNLNELWERMAILGAAALGGVVLAALAAFAIARRLQHIIATPIITLADTAGTIARGGDYSLRAAKEGRDEVGLLVDAFNEMVSQVQRRESERIALLRREQEANRLKDEFLAALSHELRTPLNAILGWIQILRATPPAESTIERALSSLDRNARAQARLIEDLLDVSRIISGKLHLSIAPIDFAVVVESAVEVIRAAAQAKQIAIETRISPARCAINGDGDRLRQVVWNLLSNAVKFTPHGGRVEVILSTTPGACELVIRDNGIGIATEFLPYVFDRFRQADGSMTRQHGGLGLGLAIVREVTLAHGGHVRVASGGPGQGATFTLVLSLPEAAVGLPVAPRAGAGVLGPRLNRLRILVVDDDGDAREVARAALAAAGAATEVADSAAEALIRLETQIFDVIVCDIAMPGTDGYALLRQIRERQAGAGRVTPAIALSAFADRDAETRARDAGFQRFVAKPFEFGDLVAAVDAVGGSGASKV